MRVIVVVALLAGCTQLLGLEPGDEVVSVRDSDEDGVSDSRDNCIESANPDQTDGDDDGRGDVCDDCPQHRPIGDRDADGVDDACDPCVLGPQVDDDGDGVFDACDLCPAYPGSDLDADGDTIGDDCDPDFLLLNERQLFDSFASLDPRWQSSDTWVLAGDATSVTPMSGTPSRLGSSNQVKRMIVGGVLAGDGIVGGAIGTATCTARCLADTCRAELTDAMGVHTSAMTFAPGPVIVWFGATATNDCNVRSAGSRFSAGLYLSLTPAAAALLATPGSRVTNVDIID